MEHVFPLRRLYTLNSDANLTYSRECPADLKEGIASLIFASPRCSEIPELVSLKKIFEKKYGNDFVSAAIELRPSCGVNRQVSLLRFAFFLVFAYNEEISVSDLVIVCLYNTSLLLILKSIHSSAC
jgi:hypothetical protein